MKSPNHDTMKKGFSRMADLERKETVRPIFTRARRLESEVDWQQLPVKSSQQLVNEDGEFYFLAGYSIVGGPDVVGE